MVHLLALQDIRNAKKKKKMYIYLSDGAEKHVLVFFLIMFNCQKYCLSLVLFLGF